MNNIINLTKMSLLNLKYTSKQTWIGWVIWICVSIYNPLFLNMLFGMGVLMTLYQVMAYEDANKIDNLIASLPVKKNEYVMSRYVAGIMFLCISIIIACGIYFISSKANTNEIKIEVLLGTGISTALLVTCIVIPMVLKFGVNKGRFLITIVNMCVIMIPSFLLENISQEPQLMETIYRFINTVSMPVIIVILNIIMLLISVTISSKSYKNKEIR
ncbi:ABC-2 transporter permease [Romboutsia sedimentorum]|uniref:ABC-2 transporter permease n=1 Tax=Romboutsia sedimentorum TaxID=1368474 RepID=A0ABT7E858_9FIRM|nr:ABC-2 transporter permease [Romboutsia sedimentorum]MDK2562146.1 ABC-2 transporter permease [Romboutsia sedimentorum]MDK2584384.1 ABC-2 transporter permease [Romboutsia sedimentorum]